MSEFNGNHHDGICPCCGSTLVDFGCAEFDDTCVIYPATCMDCGAEFSSVYSMNFMCHENIVPAQPEKTYEVFLTKTISIKRTVKASSKDEAEEKAMIDARFYDINAQYTAEAQEKGEY